MRKPPRALLGWINYVHPDDRQMVNKAVDDTVESKRLDEKKF